MNILLLEDSVTDADLTRRGLTSSIVNCTVVVAPTLKQAREILLKDNAFDIAIFDMTLPDGTGLEMLIEIRQSGFDIPAVFLTGSGNEEMATVALKAGADDYMIKRNDYISKLPGVIDFAIRNHKQNALLMSEIIDVLYIEHHASDVDLTIRFLNQNSSGIRITAISTAELALEQLPLSETEKCRFQVILLDYRLPGLNALEFTKIIRQERKLSIPIILVTGHGNEEVAIQALKLGVNEYLVKRENYLSRLPSMILNSHEHQELLKKQLALAESEEKYRYLFANNPQPMWIYDLETLAFLEINDSAIQHYGYTKEEFLSMTIKDIRPMEDIGALLKNIEKTEKMYNPSGEWRHLKKNGEIIIVEIISHTLDFNNRKARHVMVNDITKRKQSEDGLRKLSRAVEQSPVSIIITDLKGNIEYVNPKFSRISGYSFEDVKGKNLRILKSGNTTPEDYKQLWDTILSGGEWYGELLNKKKDGTLFWESASISPIHNEEGAITHFLAVKEDITEKKNEHEELIKAKEHAEESDRLKSSFLANMSHEIRTPLNSIIGFSNLLNDPDFDEEEKSEFVNNIINSGNDLLLIINDIMDLSMIESEQLKIRREHISVNKLLLELEHEFKTKASDKGIKLHLVFPLGNHDVVIENDLNRTRQILNNLIGNALKFTSKGFVEIGYSHKGNVLEFYVADSGIGISPDNFQSIFDRFRQVEIATTRNYGGNGLGLSISKKLVEMLGGRIWVESEIGKGSCFYFTLPDNPILQEEPTAPILVLTKNNENQIKSLKILVAEDDEGNSKFLNLAIRQISEKTLNVKNGFEAVEACRNNPDVDLILMDIQMPGMDGYEATRQIRQFNTTVIIIAQTAFALSDDSEKAITAGCNDYISKPIKKKQLLALVEKYFKKQGNFNC